MTLRLVILGAAAGGGLPQWNCGCPNCDAARAGEIPPATQSSLAASADGKSWAILNASPDIGSQLLATPELHPTGPRQVPIRSVLVTNGDIDHVVGLLTLREKQPFDLIATAEIQSVIAANPIFSALDPALVARRTVALGEPIALAPGLEATLFPVPGKVPLYLEDGEVVTDLEGEQTVGVELRAGGRRALYIPGCAVVTEAIRGRATDADALLFDGTLWDDEEMIRMGLGQKTGRRMGHVSISGPEGAIASFANLPIGQRVFVHINNSNPVWRPSPERAEAEASGWQIARDGLRIEL